MPDKLENAMSMSPGRQPGAQCASTPRGKTRPSRGLGQKASSAAAAGAAATAQGKCAWGGAEARGILFVPRLGLGLRQGKPCLPRLGLRLKQLAFASGLGWG